MNLRRYWTEITRQYRKISVPMRRWAQRYLPPGVRLIVGVMLIVGGFFAFLPVLGLWMIPLGVSIAALDVRPIWRWWRDKNDSKDTP